MKKRLITVAAVLSLLAAMALGIGVTVSAQEEWPVVKPLMAGTTSPDGTTATFVILIQNNSRNNLLSMDIRAGLYGNGVLLCYAGTFRWNPGCNNYGDSIGWVNQANVPPGGSQGPFVFTVRVVGPQGAVSHAWLRFKTETISADVSTDLVTASRPRFVIYE